MRVIKGIDGLRAAIGEDLGASDWVLLDQAAIDRFAEATGDDYFIHTDPQRAKEEAGLESTIAHGLLTLSLGPKFSAEVLRIEDVGSALNYGYDKVRFLAPVPVDSKVRMHLEVAAVDETDQGVRLTSKQTFEVDGAPKPVCIAEAIVFYWKPSED